MEQGEKKKRERERERSGAKKEGMLYIQHFYVIKSISRDYGQARIIVTNTI